MPLIPAMLMSIKTRSGARDSTSSTASSPESASPTSSNPEVAPTTALAASRKGAWSSAIRTLTTELSTTSSCHTVGRAPSLQASVAEGLLPPLLGEVQQHCLDPLVSVLLERQIELGEDRVDVFLYSPLRQDERPGDRGVVLALRHLPEDLTFARRQLR